METIERRSQAIMLAVAVALGSAACGERQAEALVLDCIHPERSVGPAYLTADGSGAVDIVDATSSQRTQLDFTSSDNRVRYSKESGGFVMEHNASVDDGTIVYRGQPVAGMIPTAAYSEQYGTHIVMGWCAPDPRQ